MAATKLDFILSSGLGVSANNYFALGTADSSSISQGSLISLGGAGIAKSLSVGGRLQIFNGSNYTAFVSSASGNTVYTLPAFTPATGTSVLQSDIAGVLSWVPMTASGGPGGSGTVTNSGANFLAYYKDAGTAVTANPSLSVSGSGLTVGFSTSSISSSSGALTIAGGVGIGGSLFVNSASNISGIALNSGTVIGNLTGTATTATYSHQAGYAITSGSSSIATTAIYSSQAGYAITSGSSSIATTALNINVSPSTSSSFSPILFSSSSSGSGLALSAFTGFAFNPSSNILSVSGLAVTSQAFSSSSSSGALIVTGGVGIGGSVSIGGRLQLFNGSNFTSFVSASTANTVYTLPPTSPSTGTSVLQSDSSGTLSWVPMVASSASSGTTSQNIAINQAGTANVFHPVLFSPNPSSSGSAISSDSEINFNPNTAILYVPGIAVTSTTSSITPTTGSLIVTGGVGIGGSLNVFSATAISGVTINNGNITGSLTGTATTATYSSQSGYAITSNTSTTSRNVYLTNSVENSQHVLVISPSATGSGAALSSNSAISFNPSSLIFSVPGIAITSGAHSTSFTTGALTVVGGVGIGGSLYVNGDLTINGTTSTINSVTLTVDDKNIELGSVTSPTDLTAEGGGINLKGAVDKAISWYTGTGWSSSESFNIPLYQSYKIANTSVISNSSLGTGITNSSLTALGTIRTGVWSGTAITPNYGGTGLQASFTVGDLLYANTSTTWARLSPGTSGHILVSAGTANTPEYTNPNSLTVGLAVTSRNINVNNAVENLQHTILFSPTATGTGVGVSSNTALSYNPSSRIFSSSGLAVTASTNSNNTTSGAIIVTGGVGIGQSLSLGGRIQLFNSSNYTAFISTATGNTVYSLPATSPAVGSSVLQSTAEGVMSWVPMIASSSSSGSFSTTAQNVVVNSAGSADVYHQILFTPSQSSSGSAVSSDSLLSYNASTDRLFVSGMAITSGTASTNTATGALLVTGGVGISGQLSFTSASLGFTGILSAPTMSFIGATTAPIITLSVLADNSLAWEGSSGSLFSIDNNLSTGDIFSVSDISGLPIINASAGQTVTINEFGGYTQIGNGLIPSSSTSTGTLVIQGGLGLTGNANIGGTVLISNSTTSTSTSTGALSISGGVGIGGSLWVGGIGASISGVRLSHSIAYGSLVGNVTGNVSGNITGNVSGNITGNVSGNLTGNVSGNVTGNVSGNVTGNVTGIATTASGVTQLLTSTTGDHFVTFSPFGTSLVGAGVSVASSLKFVPNTGVLTASGFSGNVTGNVSGTVTGNVSGSVTGGVSGNVTGNISGNVTGNISGNVTGNISGSVTGNLSGNVTGNISGNVTGNVTGIATTASGITQLLTSTTGDHFVTFSPFGASLVGTGISVASSLKFVPNTGVLTASGFSGNVTGTVSGNVTGNVSGSITGNVSGSVTGGVSGNVTGNVSGNVTGNVSGNLTGNVSGNVTGNVTGIATTSSGVTQLLTSTTGDHFITFSPFGTSLVGAGVSVASSLKFVPNTGVVTASGFSGNVTGNVSGTVTGGVSGNVTGNVSGSTTGNVSGNVTGNISGNVTGNVSGNVTGNISGNVTGNISGNVTGNVSGLATTASGITQLLTSTTGDHFVTFSPYGSSLVGTGISVASSLKFVPNSGVLTASGFSGNVTGNVSGNVTGNVSGNVTGNISGSVTGGVSGNVTGSVSGNVTGNLSGLATTAWNVQVALADDDSSHPILFMRPASTVSGVNGIGISNDLTLFFNPRNNVFQTSGLAVTATTFSNSATTGALTATGGVGIGGSLSVGGRIQLFNSGNYTAFVSSSTANTVYTLPATSPATGTSILQSTSGGVLSWIPFVSSGGITVGGTLDGSVQYKSGSGLAGTRDFFYNETSKTLRLGNFPGEEFTSSTSAALLIEQAIGSFNGSNSGTLIAVNALNSFNGDLLNLQKNALTRFKVTAEGGIALSSGIVNFGDNNFNATTDSTSTTSGALIVSGGAGIAKTLYVGGNFNVLGFIRSGTNTYAKNLGAGDIALDNGTVDTPAILFYWGNNRNIGIDTYYSGSGTTRFRISKELNESGGTELWSVDRNGIVTQTAWDVGEVISTRVYNNSDLSMSATTTINSSTYTTVATISYTPKSTTSHLWIEFDAHYDFSNGTTTDDFFSRITVGGSTIVEKNQIMVGQVGGGTRSGVIFPISGRYTNTATSSLTINVQAKWGSADDNIRVYGSSTSGYMRIQEIGR